MLEDPICSPWIHRSSASMGRKMTGVQWAMEYGKLEFLYQIAKNILIVVTLI